MTAPGFVTLHRTRGPIVVKATSVAAYSYWGITGSRVHFTDRQQPIEVQETPRQIGTLLEAAMSQPRARS